MKKEDLFRAMTDIDEKFIAEAAPKAMAEASTDSGASGDAADDKKEEQVEKTGKRVIPMQSRIRRYSTIAAACLVLIIGVSVGSRLGVFSSSKSSESPVDSQEMAVEPVGNAEDIKNQGAEINEAPALLGSSQMMAEDGAAQEEAAVEGAAAEEAAEEAYADLAESTYDDAEESALEDEEESETETEEESESETGSKKPARK